jgi:hypothetical protein
LVDFDATLMKFQISNISSSTGCGQTLHLIARHVALIVRGIFAHISREARIEGARVTELPAPGTDILVEKNKKLNENLKT